MQNGKQEILWGSVEGRLMAMLEGVDDLTLARLNEATQAWVEQDYNRKHHSEIDDTPLARFLAGPSVTRPCPDAAALRLAFTRTERRTLRKSDGTAVIEGRRFEVPNQYRHLSAAGGPLRRLGSHTGPSRRSAHRHGALPAVPAGQGGQRLRPAPRLAANRHRTGQTIASPSRSPPPPARGIGPLLARMIDRQAATGLPPAYLPKDEGDDA